MKKSVIPILFMIAISNVGCARIEATGVSNFAPVKNTSTITLSGEDKPQPPTSMAQISPRETMEPTAGPVSRVINGETIIYTLDDLLFSLNASVVFVDSSGGVWASSGWGVWASSGSQHKNGDLSYFDGESWISYSASDLPTAKLYQVTEAPDGSIWVAAESSGNLILHFEKELWTAHQVQYQGANFAPYDIAVDPDGKVWVVDADSGKFACFHAGTWVDYQIPIFKGITRGMECTSIETDPDGTVWIVCGFKIHRIEGGEHTTYLLEDGMPANIYPRSLAIEPNGAIWVGTDVGVSRFDGKSWTHYSQEDGLNGEYVLSIATDDHGSVYFGTNRGISMFDGEVWYTISIPDEHVGIGIKTVAVAPDGSLWYGSSKGLMHFMPQ